MPQSVRVIKKDTGIENYAVALAMLAAWKEYIPGVVPLHHRNKLPKGSGLFSLAAHCEMWQGFSFSGVVCLDHMHVPVRPRSWEAFAGLAVRRAHHSAVALTTRKKAARLGHKFILDTAAFEKLMSRACVVKRGLMDK